MAEEEIGAIMHYFDKAGVAAFKIEKGELNVGDTVHIVGHTSDITTTIESMQIEHDKVEKAGVGDAVGIKVPGKVREHDRVFKVVP